jgi:tyrosyl-tRNA synthetase
LMGRNLQREYQQESQIVVITPLLEGTDGVQKMSKSLGNYVGINEPPQEIFGKVMSISDELMWRYYELLTDLSLDEIQQLRSQAGQGDRHPRDLKVELANRIIADFHSVDDANKAEDEFNRIFRDKQAPSEIEERIVPFGRRELTHLLVELGLASSKNEARDLIRGGGVSLDDERCNLQTKHVIDIRPGKPGYDIKVGKRRFVRVRGPK